MRAVVLAAGTGSRLGKRTNSCCKGLVPVNGKYLIDYLFEFFEIGFFDEILVVGGFHYTELKNHVEKQGYKNINVYENRDYLKGNIFTLIRGLKEFSGDSFLITNTDHIYPRIMFGKMKLSLNKVTAMCDFDRALGSDDMKVKLMPDKKHIQYISKGLEEHDCGYIGMTFVDRSMNAEYMAAIDKTLSRFGEKAVVENVLQVLAEDDKTTPQICDLSGIGWYEVDTEEDLQKAEHDLPANPNFK